MNMFHLLIPDSFITWWFLSNLKYSQQCHNIIFDKQPTSGTQNPKINGEETAAKCQENCILIIKEITRYPSIRVSKWGMSLDIYFEPFHNARLLKIWNLFTLNTLNLSEASNSIVQIKKTSKRDKNKSPAREFKDTISLLKFRCTL